MTRAQRNEAAILGAYTLGATATFAGTALNPLAFSAVLLLSWIGAAVLAGWSRP